MELSELSSLQIMTRVVGFTRTHVMMLHSKFCAVQRVLLDKTTKRILLINIHKRTVTCHLKYVFNLHNAEKLLSAVAVVTGIVQQ